jgi:pyrimidine operon attenuation protein/uracil phosphoribosyltransferase
MNDLDNIPAILERMAREIVSQIEQTGRSNPAMIGIHSGGVWVAAKLHELAAITFYRDDFTRIGMNPVVRPSQLPFSIDDRHIILVDDVLHTGRTIRAAMNELFDYGRPASILLATLVERDGRELPIQANVVGSHVRLTPRQHIKLLGPETLKLEIKQIP